MEWIHPIVSVCAFFFIPLWRSSQNRMIYNYLKSFDFLLIRRYVSDTYLLLVVRLTAAFLCYSQHHFVCLSIPITFTLFIHVLLVHTYWQRNMPSFAPVACNRNVVAMHELAHRYYRITSNNILWKHKRTGNSIGAIWFQHSSFLFRCATCHRIQTITSSSKSREKKIGCVPKYDFFPAKN